MNAVPMELIPAIDLKEGRCVRLFKGDFAAETVYSNEPERVLERYREIGARTVHVVDLDGARDGNQPNREVILNLASKRRVRLQVGGGLRTLTRVKALLDAGIDRVVIGSVAVTAPDEVAQWMAEIDPRQIVLAFDVRLNESDVPMLTTHGWLKTSTVSLWEAVERFLPSGLTHVLCTDVARDGMLEGPDIEGALRLQVEGAEVIVSGGVSSLADLRRAAEAGLAGAIVGRALYESRFQLSEALDAAVAPGPR